MASEAPHRVLFVNSFYTPEVGGGAELTLHRLATALVERGHTVAAFTTGEGESVDEVDGVTVHRFPIDNAFRKLDRDLPSKPRRVRWQWRDRSSALMARRLDDVIRTVRPDVVQFHNIAGITRSAWSVPARHGATSVQVLHDLNLICPNSSMFRHGRSCVAQCASCALFRRGFATDSRRVDAVVGVSAFVLDRLVAAGYFEGSVQRVIYNAQRLPGPSPLVDGDELRFGFIGALSPAKGIEWLIESFDDSLGTLSVAGTGDAGYVAHLKAMAEGKRIEFMAHVPSRAFFPTIDVGVVPSLWNDTLPGVAIEGGAHGRPMIVSRRGGLPEIVRDGETGLLVDPDRPETLAAAMHALVADRRLVRRMAQAAPVAVATFTDLDRLVEEYRSLWSELRAERVSAGERMSR